MRAWDGWGPAEAVLDVTEGRIDPFEGGPFGGLGSAAGNGGIMAAASRGDGGEAAQAVADDGASRGQDAARHFLDLCLAEALHPGELEPVRPTLGGGFHGGHERRFAGCATAPLTAAPGAPQIGVVDLDPLALAAQRLVFLAFKHHLHQFVMHLPRRIVADPEPAPQFEAGNPFLRLADQVEGLEPYDQRQVGRMKDRPRRQRHLVMAAAALIQPPTLVLAVAITGTAGTNKTLRPAPAEYHRPTFLLAKFTKPPQTQPQLNRIPRHRKPPEKPPDVHFLCHTKSAEESA